MERDFVEMLSALNATDAEYLVVGAHALAAHGVPRPTVEGVSFGVLGQEVLRNKRATGRPKDLLDAETLESPDRRP